MWAAFTGDADCVKALIAAGADVNAKISYVWGGNNNRGGWTAPDFADLAGNAEVAAILRSERART
jgi:ankyrin repeat protein